MNAPHPYSIRKDPSIAVLLSFLWTGAGQVYAGSTTKGIILIAITSFIFLVSLASAGLGFCVAFPYWIWGMFDANSDAKLHNRRHRID